MMAWKTEGTKLYQQLPAEMMQYCKVVEPLRSVPTEYAQQQEHLYKPGTKPNKFLNNCFFVASFTPKC
jgi:hypothetical protein